MDGDEVIENKPFVRWTMILISILLIEFFFFVIHSLIAHGPQGRTMGRGITIGAFGFVILYWEIAGYFKSPRKVVLSKDWFEFYFLDKNIKRYRYDQISSLMVHVWDRSTLPGGPTRFGFVSIKKGEHIKRWNRQRLNYPAANSLLNRFLGTIPDMNYQVQSPLLIKTRERVVIDKERLRDRYLIGGVLFLVIGFGLTFPLALIAIYFMDLNFESMYLSLWAIVSLAGTIWCFRIDIRGRRRVLIDEAGVKVYVSLLQRFIGQRSIIKGKEIERMILLIERGIDNNYDNSVETRYYLVLILKNGKEVFLGERGWGNVVKMASELKDRWGIETII